MPNLRNAKKALRQSKKRYERNKIYRAEIDSLRRKLRKLIESGNVQEAELLISTINKAADKAVTKNIIKKNKAARTKSRSMKMLKKLQAK